MSHPSDDGVEVSATIPNRVFLANEARAVALEVVDHDPAERRAHSLIPSDRAAADAAVVALSDQLRALPGSMKSALEGAAENAALLSDDRLQGIAELIQNADDLRAQHATFTIDELNSNLVFQHDGRGLTLHDVWGLAIPWLSMKASDSEQIGRFGIGLKTLHSLSRTIVVHQGNFSVRVDDRNILPVSASLGLSEKPEPELTTFSIPFAPGAVRSHDVAEWLRRWGEGGLLFLRHLDTITLRSESNPLSLHVGRGEVDNVATAGEDLERQQVSGSDTQSWTTYTRKVPIPVESVRARKASSSTVRISVAFPDFQGDEGHIHIGLPVRAIGLPFRMNAPFDPLASRRDISDTDWNLTLLSMLSDLWHDAAVDRFAVDAARGWMGVPLAQEFKRYPLAPRLSETIEQRLLSRARTEFASNVRVRWNDEPRGFAELAYEQIELEGLISAEDIRDLAHTIGAIAADVRSMDDRWRCVLVDLAELDAITPFCVEVTVALDLLNDYERPPAFVGDLVAVAIAAGLEATLENYECVVLRDGTRVAPEALTGLQILIPLESGGLWSTLGYGSHLHSEYMDRRGSQVVKDWLMTGEHLLEDTSDEAALRALSAGGKSGGSLPDPLTNEQLHALRRALEDMSDTLLRTLGPGIGLAIKVNGQTYDNDNRRKAISVRPGDSYFYEGSATSWGVAAAQTPGIKWIERRYSDTLKANDGLGAQRFFRALGAEVAPRLIAHRSRQSRFLKGPQGVRIDAPGSPLGRVNKMLGDLHARYTLDDLESPDMVAVLKTIAAEEDENERIRRTVALLATLSRSWDRMTTTVRAAWDDGRWYDRGRIDAWWLSVASATRWLTADDGSIAAPALLNLRTAVNIVSLGDEPGHFLSSRIDPLPYRTVLDALGVGGDPGVDELLKKLKALAAESASKPEVAGDRAAPYYVSLAGQIESGTLADRHNRLRGAFNAGSGLIASNRGWRRCSDVFSGPPVLGQYVAFVPSVEGTEPLWNSLGISPPGASEAVAVLKALSKSKPTVLPRDGELVMVEALRILAATTADRLPKLRRAPVWVGDAWSTERPVYAVLNPLLARGLSSSLPVWSPGGSIAQLQHLVEPYGMTSIDGGDARVLGAVEGIEDVGAGATFKAAVSILREDLALSDSVAEQSLIISWEELERWRVQVLKGLEIQIPNPIGGLPMVISMPAWADVASSTLFVAEDADAGRLDSGAHAIAALFSGDRRRISHDWLAAWAKATGGVRAEHLLTAASLDAEVKRSRSAAARDAASQVRLSEVSNRVKKRPSRVPASFVHESPPDGESATKPEVDTPRLLIDLDDFVLLDDRGKRIDVDAPLPIPRSRTDTKLRVPDRTNPKSMNPTGVRPPNYSAEERETLGLRAAQWVLGLDDQTIVDIRNQRGIGADAIDQLDNFYELKVHSGPIPDEIKLEPSEITRALATEDFFLVVIGNLEVGRGEPEVRVIVDPLRQLTLQSSQSVRLSGVLSASNALQFRLSRTGEPHP